MTTVRLRPAFAWDCEACGRENFARAVVPEMSPEDLQELRDEHGIEEYIEGMFLVSPEEVTCAHCAASFTANDDRTGNE